MRQTAGSALLLGLVGCVYAPAKLPQIVTLQFGRGDTGTLDRCLPDNVCTSLPNPYDCTTLEVTVNLDAGTACVTCTSAKGAVISTSCSDTVVGCTRLATSDAECLVCAQQDGIVLFSDCPDATPVCAAITCLDAPTCYPGQRLDTAFPYCCGACMPDATTCVPYDQPYCEGSVVSSGHDAWGCPQPPSCLCADGSVSDDGRCPCVPACETCQGGVNYVVADGSCCGYHCQECTPAQPLGFDCLGDVVIPLDANGCPMTPICRCAEGAISTDGTCNGQPCAEPCDECVPGTAYVAYDTGCCGYHCVQCAALAYSFCDGIPRIVADANGCGVRYECICPDYTVSVDGSCTGTTCTGVMCAACPFGLNTIDDGSCCGTCSNGCKTCTYSCPSAGECVVQACLETC
jgi:hypothetical protein